MLLSRILFSALTKPYASASSAEMRWPDRKTFRSFSKYLLACASEIAAPVLRTRLAHLPPPMPPEKWRKGLLMGASHIGDILYRSCALGPLAEAFPGCEWHILAPSAAGEVIRHHSGVRKIHPFDVDAGRFEVLLTERYDVAVCYDVGTYFAPLRLAVRLGIPNRVAYAHKGFSAWVTHPVSIRWPQPFPAYFRDLVADLARPSEAISLRPAVTLSAEDKSTGTAAAQALGFAPGQPWLACFPLSRQPGTADASAKVFEILAAYERLNPAVGTVLLGAPDEMAALTSAKTLHQLRAKILSPALPVRSLVAFLQHPQAVLCADSGPRHLANAAECPVFFVRNLASNAIETGVYLDSETDLSPPDFGGLAPEARRPVLESIDADSAAVKIVLRT